MTQKELTRRIFVLERERDGLRAENCKLRDFLLARARECESCDGTGCATVHEETGPRVEACGDCYPIRDVLGQ